MVLSKKIVLLCSILCLATACSSGGGDASPVDEGPIKDDKNTDLKEPLSFQEQNLLYTKAFVEQLLDEKKDQRVLQLLQFEKNDEAKKLSQVNEDLNLTNVKINRLKSEKTELENKNNNKSIAKANLTNEKQANLIEIADLNNEINDVEQKINTISKKINNHEASIQNLENKRKNFISKREKRKEDLNQLKVRKENLSKKINNNKSKVQSLKQKNQNLKQKLANATDPNEKKNIKSQIQKNKNQIDSLNIDSEDKKKTLADIKNNKIPEMQQRIANLNGEINAKNQEISQASNKLSQLSVRKDNLISIQRDLLRDKNRLVVRNKQINSELSELGQLPQKIVSKNNEIKKYEIRRIELVSLKALTQNSFDKKSKSHQDFSAKIAEKRQELVTLEELNDLSLDKLYETF